LKSTRAAESLMNKGFRLFCASAFKKYQNLDVLGDRGGYPPLFIYSNAGRKALAHSRKWLEALWIKGFRCARAFKTTRKSTRADVK